MSISGLFVDTKMNIQFSNKFWDSFMCNDDLHKHKFYYYRKNISANSCKLLKMALDIHMKTKYIK